jgi:hypothetical protein
LASHKLKARIGWSFVDGDFGISFGNDLCLHCNAAEDPDPCYIFALALYGTVQVFVVLCRMCGMCGMCGMCNKGMVLGKGMLYVVVSDSIK